jgi:beta-glucosidase
VNAAYRNPELPLPERVADLLSRLTTAEKIAMLHQYQPAVPRLGIAPFRTGTEALHGVAWLGPATVFPLAIGLASTWNADLVRAVGDATGTEVRGFHDKDPVAHGLNVWAPVVNPLRDPRWGRNEEGYSEDPLLTAVMGTAYASGLRGDHPVYLKTAPTVKHFLAYNNETDRFTTSSSVRDRVLHEYEYPCHRGPIESGAAVAVMPSYNLVNGRPAHLTPHLNEDLRSWTDEEVAALSDALAPSNVVDLQGYYATQVEGYAALLRAGLDSFTDHENDPRPAIAILTEALGAGLINESDVDRAVGRVLTMRLRLGEFDPPGANPYAEIKQDVIANADHGALALEAARQSIVLLKNDEALLPLDPERTGRIAAIGTHADTLFNDRYSGTLPYAITPVDGLKALHGNGVECVEGVDRVTLRAGDRYLTVQREGTVSGAAGWSEAAEFDLFDWGQGFVTLRVAATGEYLAVSEEGGLVVVGLMPGGRYVRELFEITHLSGEECSLRNIALDRHLAVREDGVVEFVEAADAATVLRLGVERDGLAQAISVAAAADVAIVFVGNDPHINGRETQDRVDLDLPPRQAELVRAVRRVNPRTVLVVVSSYPYALVWEDRNVPAVLWSSHGGQEFGRALAEVVFGRTTPSGRLTQTWYRNTRQLPDLLDYDIISAGSTYLYLDDEPLYPFGHGLSYTSFGYGPLHLSSGAVRPDHEVVVSVEVTNTGDVHGTEIVQLYGRQRESRVKQPLRRLLAFERVPLTPGEQRTVRFSLRGNDFWHWDVVSGRRVVEAAEHVLWAGPSCQAIAARAVLRVLGEELVPRRLDAPLRAEHFDECGHVVLSDETKVSGTVVESREPDGWVVFRGVRFGGESTCTLRLASRVDEEAVIELHADDGESIAVLKASLGDDPYGWRDVVVPVRPLSGVRDLTVRFGRTGIRLSELRFGTG